MVLLTRSAAKKAAAQCNSTPTTPTRPEATAPVRTGTFVTIEKSATGLGVHKRWHYPEATTVTDLNRTRESNHSFSSMSSLSSLSDSDEEARHSSLSSMSSLSSLSSTASLRGEAGSSHPPPPETPARPTTNDTPNKRSPLKRSPFIRWTTDGTTDRFVVSAPALSAEEFQMREEAKAQRLDEVFEEQYAIMIRQKEMALLRLQRLSDSDSDDDIDVDDGEIAGPAYGLRPLVRGDTEPLVESPRLSSTALGDPFELASNSGSSQASYTSRR